MSAKKFLLAATVLTPFLFAMAQPARSQTAPAPAIGSSEEAEQTAQDIEKMIQDGEVDPGDIGAGVPGETPVLAEDDAAEKADKEKDKADSNQLDWLFPVGPIPPGSAHAWTELKVEGGICFIYLHTVYLTPDGKTTQIDNKARVACPVDSVEKKTDGTTTEHYRDGTILIKDGTGKLVGVIPPAISIPPTTTKETAPDGTIYIKDGTGKVIGAIPPAVTAPKPEPKTEPKTAPKTESRSTSMKPKVKETTAVAARTPTRTLARPVTAQDVAAANNAQVIETLANVASFAIMAHGVYSGMRAERMHGMMGGDRMMGHGGGMMDRGFGKMPMR